MTTPELYIDGTDIFTEYNVRLADGCYDTLVGWPGMKDVEGNDWQEQDGFEPDLSNPLLESRTITLKYILHGSIADIHTFYAFLGTVPTRTYNFAQIGRTLTLRLEAMPSVEYAVEFHVLQVRYAADKPLEGYSYLAPASTLEESREYVLDSTPLSDYGIRILQGTISSVIKGSDVKPLLIRKSSVISGATYDENPLLNDPDNSFGDGYETVGTSAEGVSGNWKRSTERGTVTYKGRDITLRCFLRADTPAAAWRNYDALLYDLTKKDTGASDPTLAGARTILIRALARTFLCYYKSQNVVEFAYDERQGIWLKFDLTLRLFKEL